MPGRPDLMRRWSSTAWVRLRRVVQAAALLAFLALFVSSRRGGWPPWVVNLPMRLDPLAMVSHLAASRALVAGSALALATIGLTLVAGRVWCGWLCPVGTLLDWLPLRRAPGDERIVPESWRGVKHVVLATALLAALFANLTLLVLDPLTTLYRTLSTAVWPGTDQLVTAAETALYRVPILQPVVAAFDGLVRPAILPVEPIYYRYTVLYALVFGAVVALNLVAHRFWCRYVCPLGALLGLVSKVALLKRSVDEGCTECGACATKCPTGTIQGGDGYASDPAECTMCLECASVCPAEVIRFPARLARPRWNAYDPGRRHLLAALGATAAGVGLFRSELLSKWDKAQLIRPPGAAENGLMSRCIRCGECVRACPTGAIQPAVTEAGLEGLWTPVMVFRAGYCDYSCNACGLVCPVQAIPPLSLEQKREQVIGTAYIDQNRCIAWADDTDCIVCEEMCPVPDKAIILEEAEVANAAGDPFAVQRPRVIRERCIGCGICEYKCPVTGEAAIQVQVPSDIPGEAL